MEIREIESALDQALLQPNNDEVIARYGELVSTYLKENKSSDEIVSIVVRGINIDWASNYYDYVENAPKNDMPSIWKQIRESKDIAENKSNNGLRFISGLLSMAFMKAGNIESYAGNIITKLVNMIDDDKRPVIKESYMPILSDSFIDEVESLNMYPRWEDLRLTGEINKRFAELVSQVTIGDDDKHKSLKHWVSIGLRYADELIEKEKIEAKIPDSKVEELQQLVEHYKNAEKLLRDNTYEIAKQDKVIAELRDEVERLNSEKRVLETEIASLRGDVKDHQDMIAEREKEIEARKKINDAADALKKNDEEGLLKDIANALRSEYSDYIDSKDDTMDEVLGEIQAV